MKFAIITHVIHKKEHGSFYAYEPYVREMNLWLKNVSKIRIVAPFSKNKTTNIDERYRAKNIDFKQISSFNVLTFKNKITSLFKIPFIGFEIIKSCYWADHIHLRCPGNIGLLGCIVQIFFPLKKKTVKYAGNWDPNSLNQPLSYKIQKWIISNTFLTRNCKVLVYGNWKNQTKNIIPFFTASYTKEEINQVEPKHFSTKIKFIFVGAFSIGKQPGLSVKIIKELLKKGYNVQLDMYGNGVEYKKVEKYVFDNKINNNVFLHGNQSKEVVKLAYQKSHFLVFISKSEGWPKVIAEAMFWSCLPISTKVSCVPYMLKNGERGVLIKNNINEIVSNIELLINNEDIYQKKVISAKKWSQQFTLDKFSYEIKQFI
ncbi:glycosyltransferase involved in cell wall biosynthesis [Lutibacter sp. Hel_I_33_5]|uniref:glycosyltransferase n=1 Tax=Lutibacter sp. Hel_I_33_5 TaxID=1566289 RepID=UPI0011A933B4|nr:glycosyltransferase [Lutibacter sp. Hel_I_33_5]TVZ54868.1 glycosyltransferase involved in cell wall biosynthesis [Lutibacter sp. Hel_I_33_5]